MSGPPYPLPNTANYQSEPAKVNHSIEYLHQKATEAKQTVEALLYLLDMQEKVPWPDMLEKFSALGNTLSQLQSSLKKSALQSGQEDHGSLLRCHVLVPQRLQLEVDPALQDMTGHRIHSWNHEIVPNYLRTKNNTDLENEECSLETEKNSKSGRWRYHHSAKSGMNKHVDTLANALPGVERSTFLDSAFDRPTHNKDDTVKLVRDVWREPSIATATTAAGLCHSSHWNGSAAATQHHASAQYDATIILDGFIFS